MLPARNWKGEESTQKICAPKIPCTRRARLKPQVPQFNISVCGITLRWADIMAGASRPLVLRGGTRVKNTRLSLPCHDDKLAGPLPGHCNRLNCTRSILLLRHTSPRKPVDSHGLLVSPLHTTKKVETVFSFTASLPVMPPVDPLSWAHHPRCFQ